MAKTKTYKVGNDVYDIPENEAKDFLSNFKDAIEVESYIVDKDTFDIPLAEIQEFKTQFPKAQPLKKNFGGEPTQTDGKIGGTSGATAVQSTESKKMPSPVSLIAQMQEKAIKDSGEQTKQEIKASNLTPVELRTISDRLVQSVNTAKQKQFPLEIPDPELKTKIIPQPKDELLSKFNQDAIAGVEDNVKLILKEDPKLQDKTRKGFLSDAEQFEIVEKAISRNMINANNGIDILNARGVNKIIESYAKDTEEVNKIGSELNIMASEMETLKKDNKINEFNKLVPQYNEKIKQYQQQSKSIEKYQEYEPQIKEYYGYIEQYNNGLKQLTEAKSKYPTLELAEKAQKVANTEFYENNTGNFALTPQLRILSDRRALDLGAAATNSIVDAYKGLFTFPAKKAADWGETLDPSLRKQYKPSDAFVDFMDRTITKPFLTKESIDSKFINPNTGNINWGVYPALKSVANNVGFTTMLALTGRAITPILTRQFAASAPTLTASLNAANKAKVWTTVLPAYMGVYTQNSKEADEMGLTGAKKLAYVNIISGLEGVSELIMPDQDLIMPNLKQRLLKDFVKDYAKGKTFAVKNLVLGIAENAGKEQIEELMVMAGKNLTTAVYNIADGETKVYVPTVGEFVETMMVAGVMAGAMTAPTKLVENSRFRKVALYKMATNYEASKAILDQINPSNKQQILEEMQVFQTQIGKLPNDVSDIKKAEIALRLNEISEINKQSENPELSDTIKKVNEKRVSELEKEIYGIITDKEYDARYAEEMNKLATETISEDPITIEEDAETDDAAAKISELEIELKQLASGTVAQAGEAIAIEVEPTQGVTFEYKSLSEIPKELKGIEPISKSEMEIGGVKKIRLTYSGQQLIDAGLAKPKQEPTAETDGVKESDTTQEVIEPIQEGEAGSVGVGGEVESRLRQNDKNLEALDKKQKQELAELNKRENKNYADAFDILNVNEYSQDQSQRSKDAIELANRHQQEFEALNNERKQIQEDADKLTFSDYNFENKKSILDKLKNAIRDVFNKDKQALDSGFEVANQSLDAALEVGADQYVAHGMGKTNLANAFNDLITLFTKGINPSKGRGSLDIAPLAGGVSTGTTSSGNAYMDGAFTLVANRGHQGAITNINQVGGIIVNEGMASKEVINALRELFPNLVIESTSNTKSLVEQLNRKSEQSLKETTEAEVTATEQVEPTLETKDALIEAKNAEIDEIESKRKADLELRLSDLESIELKYGVKGYPATFEAINAKYDAERKALEQTQPIEQTDETKTETNDTKPIAESLKDVESTAKALEGVSPRTRKEKAEVLTKKAITQKDGKWTVSESGNRKTTFDVFENDLIAEYLENKKILERTQGEIENANKNWEDNIVPKYGNIEYNKMSKEAYEASQEKTRLAKSKEANLLFEAYLEQRISEAYHKAKKDGSNPELVAAVEELLTPKIEQDAKEQQSVQEQPQRTSDSDMPIVNEAELQDGKAFEEEVAEIQPILSEENIYTDEVLDLARRYMDALEKSQTQDPTSIGTAEEQILANGLGKVSKKSYKTFGDPNKIGVNMARTWFVTNKDASGMGASFDIDVIAQSLGVTPKDIVDYIENYPSGTGTPNSKSPKTFYGANMKAYNAENIKIELETAVGKKLSMDEIVDLADMSFILSEMYADKISDADLDMFSDNPTQEELIELNKKLNDAYGTEQTEISESPFIDETKGNEITESLSERQQLEDKVKQAEAELKKAREDRNKQGKNLGVIFDPMSQAEADIKVLSKLKDYVVAKLQLGAYDIKTFFADMKRMGIEVSKDTEQKWNEWFDGIQKTAVKRGIDKETGVTRPKPTEQKRIDKAYALGVADTKEVFKAKIAELRSDFEQFYDNVNELKKDATDLIKSALNKDFISQRTFETIMNRLGKAKTPTQYQKLFDYISKAAEQADYAERMSEVSKLQAQANKRNHTSLTKAVKDFTSINPELIPDSLLPQYIQALDELSGRVPSYQTMQDTYLQVMASKQPPKQFDEISTLAKAQELYNQIGLNQVQNVEEYVNLFKDINAFKRKILQLIDNEIDPVIIQGYEQMLEDVGKDQQAVEAKYATEIEAIKKEMIAGLRNSINSTSTVGQTLPEKSLLSDFFDLTNSELENLSPEELYNLQSILDNVKEYGYVDVFRLNPLVVKAKTYGKPTTELSNQIKKAKSFNEAFRDKFEAVRKLGGTFSSFWETTLGLQNLGMGAFTKYIAAPMEKAVASYRREVENAYSDYVKIKEKYGIQNDKPFGIKKTLMDKAGKETNQMTKLGMISTYLREYAMSFDEKYAGKKDADQMTFGTRDWFAEILNNPKKRSNYTKEEIDRIREVHNKLPKVNGKVDVKAVWDSYVNGTNEFLTKNEMGYLKEVNQWKEKNITDKQKYANELRGKSFDELLFHIKRMRKEGGKSSSDPVEINTKNNNIRIAAGSGKEVTNDNVGAIEVDFEKIFTESVEETYRDFYMTPFLQEQSALLNNVEKNIPEDKYEYIVTTKENLQAALNNEFANPTIKGYEKIIRNLTLAKAAQVLIAPIRTGYEMISSYVSYPFRAGALNSFSETFRNKDAVKKLLEFTNSPLLNKADVNKHFDVVKGNVEGKGMLEKAIDFFAAMPERNMVNLVWMASFDNEFKKATGKDFDRARINDNSYLRENKKAIEEAGLFSDMIYQQIAGSTTSAGTRRFALPQGKVIKALGLEGITAKSTGGQIITFFTNYPFRETEQWLKSARGIKDMAKDRNITSENAKYVVYPIVGTFIGASLYQFMQALGFQAKNYLSALYGDDDEEKEKAKLEMERIASPEGIMNEMIAGAASTAGTRYGSITKAALQLAGTMVYNLSGNETIKEKGKAITRELTFKNPLELKRKKDGSIMTYGMKQEIASQITSYIPFLQVIVDNTFKAAESVGGIEYLYQKVENGEKLTDDEKDVIIALQSAVNITNLFINFSGKVIPFTSEIERFGREAKKEQSQSTTKQGSTLEERQTTERQTTERQATERIVSPRKAE